MLLDENNECLVPWEALTLSGNMFVSVYSGDRITASKARVRILPTGYTDSVDTTQDPTVDVYQSLITRMDTIDEHVETSVENALTEAKESGDFDGAGISGIVMNDDYTLTITYSDGKRYTTEPIRGAIGATPDMSIGTIQTLEPSDQATASITGTAEAPVLNLGIPKGQVGSTPTMSIGTVTTLNPTDPATATITGTSENPVLNLGIPRGAQGEGGGADVSVTGTTLSFV